MADGKAQITDLNLTQIDANLSDYLSDIRPYEGFVQCNSPWIGGLLNNVYKKKVTGLPEGHKLIKVHNGDIYSLLVENENKNGVYKNNIKIGEVENVQPKVRDYTDPFCRTTANNELIVNYYDVKNYIISYDVPFTYDYVEYENNLYITIYPIGNIKYEDFENPDSGIRTFVFNHAELLPISNNYKGLNAVYICNGDINTEDGFIHTVGDYILSNFESFQTINDNLYYFNISPLGIVMYFNWVETMASGEKKEQKSIFLNYCSVLGLPKINDRGQTIRDVDFSHTNNVWTRGLLIPSSSDFCCLIYNNEISGISINNSVLTYNVDKIVKIKPCSFDNSMGLPNRYTGSIIYESEGKLKELYCEKNEDNLVNYSISGNYVFFKTVGYYNTLNLETGELFCRSDDWNDRLVPIITDKTTAKTGMFVSGWNVNAITLNKNAFSSQYSQQVLSYMAEILYSNYRFFKVINRQDLELKHNIEIYGSNSPGENAKYISSIGYGSENQVVTYKDFSLEGTLYPQNTDNNMLYNLPVLFEAKDSYINEMFVTDKKSSYILIKAQNKETLLGYYLFTETEVNNIFLTQGQFYGINDEYIYSVGLDNSVVSINGVVANKQDLMFLGAFPTMALFWSKLDKSLYSFTGDAILQKVKEAYRINNIYNVYCDPSRLTMIISTDIGVIIIYQNQTMLLEEMKEPIEHIYYDSNTYVLDDTLLSLSEQENYEPQNIKLHTEYYGVGSGVKSVNDCVYIRIAKGKKNGFIKFQSFVLNDRSTASEEKTVDLPDSVFDPITKSAFIKYQPKNQAGLGFSVKIETTNPVVSMAIGHKPESIANTALKL